MEGRGGGGRLVVALLAVTLGFPPTATSASTPIRGDGLEERSVPGPSGAARAPGADPDTIPFRHAQHAEFDCRACHATGGATTSANQAWCAECHHSGAAFERCGDCHAARDVAGLRRVPRTLSLSVGPPKRRELPFDHAVHSSVGCRECHAGTAMPASVAECGACHEPHHRPDADCTACHADPPEDAHTLAVHTDGCGGSGCHAPPAAGYGSMERTRSFCLSCHQEMVGHEEGGLCVDCHFLPGREAGGDGSRSAHGEGTDRDGR